ncbi:MAG: tetratricopeptide repeat protein [Candidatus Sumerlaeota bacterium]|nr:tetratricopeptide repeat protein [Candidatus Sumerlaeota bacterium]
MINEIKTVHAPFCGKRGVFVRAYPFCLLLLLLLVLILSSCSFLYEKTPDDMRREAIDYFGNGQKLENKGEYLLAIEEFLKAAEISPRPVVYYHLGHCFLQSNEPDRAIIYFQKAMDMAPDYREAQIALESAKLKAKRVDRQLASRTAPTQMPSAAPVSNPPSPQKTESPTPAAPMPIPILTPQPSLSTPPASPAKVEQTPASSPFPFILGLPSQKGKKETKPTQPLPPINEVEKALFPGLFGEQTAEAKREEKENLDRYIDRKKKSMDNFAFHFDKARQYSGGKLYQAALLEYIDALKVDPVSLDAISELADMYRLTGRLERAEQVFINARKNFLQNPHFFLKWGNLYLNLDLLDKAEEKFKEAIYYLPRFTSALNNLGIIEMKRKNYARAAEYFESILASDPNFASAHLNLGIIYSDHLKNPQKAIEHFEAYLKIGGKRAEDVSKWLKNLKP